jgi:hypothetical protein
MTVQTQIEANLAEAQARLMDSELSYNQVRFNMVNIEESKNVAKISKLLKKLNVNADHLSENVRAYGDYLSDAQRAADGTRPYSGGLTITTINDDEFNLRLQAMETRSIQEVLRVLPEHNTTTTTATDAVKEDDTIQTEIQSFLTECDEESEEEDERIAYH